MIGYLCGHVVAKQREGVILDVGGVGYCVGVPAGVVGALTVGQEVTLWIETLMHEGAIQLFGFQDPQTQTWFRYLIGVQGVGGRVAQNILGAMTLTDLVQAVRSQNTGVLRRAEGVGPRLAVRLCTELAPHALRFALDSSSAGVENPEDQTPEVDDAVTALIALGYRRGQALQAVQKALKEVGGVGDGGRDAYITALVRQALHHVTLAG